MAHKPERGRYLTLEDVRVSYKHKDDTIHLTSSDPDIPNGSFHITLNKGTSTEESLRELLKEHELIKEDSIAATQPLVKISNPIAAFLADAAMGNPHYVEISGRPGSGKTVTGTYFAYLAHSLKFPTVIVDSRDDYSEIAELSGGTKYSVADMPDGYLNPFQMYAYPSEQKEAACKIITMLLKELVSKDTMDKVFNAVHLVRDSDSPSQDSLVEILSRSADPEIFQAGKHLKSFSTFPFASLIFKWNKESKKLPLFEQGNGIGYITLNSLSLPETYTLEKDFTSHQTLGTVIREFIMEEIAEEASANSHIPKLLLLSDSTPDNVLQGKAKAIDQMADRITRDKLTIVNINAKKRVTSNLFVTDEFLFDTVFVLGVREAAQLNVGDFIWLKAPDGQNAVVNAVTLPPAFTQLFSN